MKRLNPMVLLGKTARCSHRRKLAVLTYTTAGFRPRLSTTSRAGFGLVEVICSTLIVGIVIVASLETVGAVFRTQRTNADQVTGPNLAMELMTEVLSLPYEDPEVDDTDIGLDVDEGTATRADFDDVDDYNGWSNIGVEAKDGTPSADHTGWRRQVAVTWVEPSSGAPSASETRLKKITVTVTSADGAVTQLTAYRAKDGMLERSEADMSAVTWLGGRLQLGPANPAASLGTNLTNHAADVD